MLALLGESALRSLLLGGVVWIGLKLLRVKNPHVHMASWTMVLLASSVHAGADALDYYDDSGEPRADA